MNDQQDRFDARALESFCSAVLQHAGMPEDKADVVATGLVCADLYGHDTHGLALLPEYVEEIESGEMQTAGAPEVLSSFGAVACWDARRLPGIWTTVQAVNVAVERAESLGIGAVAIRRSHHIASLAAYLEAPARRGFVVLVFSSDPSDAHVAPFGGTTPVMTPNPVAAGIPCSADPILIDISTSITTAGRCARARGEDERLPGPWLIEDSGAPTTDPGALTRGGSILPVGGTDHGHKGFGLGLLVEALTQGLSGFGRVEEPTGWGAAVLVLAFAPQAFGSARDFMRQVDWLADACVRSKPVDQGVPVRLPGQLALERKAEAERNGVALYPGIAAQLRGVAARFDMAVPEPLTAT
ncbi:MAG: Ldh family oxidoreductase [Gammaproteobacteria bacterium]